jgi:hypothetical protein
MQCLRYLCVQCRDPMNLVTFQNGVTVPDGTGKSVTLHSECFRTWLDAQVENELTPNLQSTNRPLPISGRSKLIRLFIGEPRRALEHLRHLPILRRHHPQTRS